MKLLQLLKEIKINTGAFTAKIADKRTGRHNLYYNNKLIDAYSDVIRERGKDYFRANYWDWDNKEILNALNPYEDDEKGYYKIPISIVQIIEKETINEIKINTADFKAKKTGAFIHELYYNNILVDRFAILLIGGNHFEVQITMGNPNRTYLRQELNKYKETIQGVDYYFIPVELVKFEK